MGLAGMTKISISGFEIYKSYLDAEAQAAVLADVRAIVRAAPLMQPVTPGGRPMSAAVFLNGHAILGDRLGLASA